MSLILKNQAQNFLVLASLLGLSCAEEAADPIVFEAGRTCTAPEGMGRPTTIKAVLDLIDALPRPVTVECFIDSLDRPLAMVGSTSVFSAQPAFSDEAPRIFAVNDTLIISWVPDGDGGKLLEFAEERPFSRSVKAEVVMPVEGEFKYSDAFDHLIQDDQATSTCGICHGQETRAMDIDYGVAFESLALRPRDLDQVNVTRMRELKEACDPAQTPQRCKIWNAMFRGPVEDTDFGRSLPTFF